MCEKLSLGWSTYTPLSKRYSQISTPVGIFSNFLVVECYEKVRDKLLAFLTKFVLERF